MRFTNDRDLTGGTILTEVDSAKSDYHTHYTMDYLDQQQASKKKSVDWLTT